jgi:hypothetical protein
VKEGMKKSMREESVSTIAITMIADKLDHHQVYYKNVAYSATQW